MLFEFFEFFLEKISFGNCELSFGFVEIFLFWVGEMFKVVIFVLFFLDRGIVFVVYRGVDLLD